MKTILFLLEKEFAQIFRNKAILRLIFIMPIIQLIVLPLAADYEVKNINFSVVDHDHSAYSRRLIGEIEASTYFTLVDNEDRFEHAIEKFERDQSDIILEIPTNFERSLIKESEASVLITVNAVNGVKGNLGAAYAANIIRGFNNDIRLEWMTLPKMAAVPEIRVLPTPWYNTKMSYKLFMVPGILVVLVTMVGTFLSALNIVHEKEVGTIEQINVTPIKKYHFILGKLIPFWLLGNLVLGLGLFVAFIVYGIIPVGSLFLIFSFSAVYLIATLGLGLLISNFAETQQQAMFFAFLLMMLFILLGGLYTPIESMPDWAKIITKFNPAAYFIEVIRMIVLKGSGLRDILPHFKAIAVFALVFNALAIWSYRKQV